MPTLTTSLLLSVLALGINLASAFPLVDVRATDNLCVNGTFQPAFGCSEYMDHGSLATIALAESLDKRADRYPPSGLGGVGASGSGRVAGGDGVGAGGAGAGASGTGALGAAGGVDVAGRLGELADAAAQEAHAGNAAAAPPDPFAPPAADTSFADVQKWYLRHVDRGRQFAAFLCMTSEALTQDLGMPSQSVFIRSTELADNGWTTFQQPPSAAMFSASGLVPLSKLMQAFGLRTTPQDNNVLITSQTRSSNLGSVVRPPCPSLYFLDVVELTSLAL